MDELERELQLELERVQKIQERQAIPRSQLDKRREQNQLLRK
ncbi:hypothetical protein ACX35B_001905 [Enterococcus faecalis]|nr:hypothetical protein [Enterococcus faecalis]